VFHSR